MDNGRVAGLTKLFRATARRRLALVLLLVVGGGMITFVLLHHGEPSRAASSETPPAGRVTATDETTASSADVVAESAPGEQYAPMRIRIPAIAASAPVDPLGLNRDGTLQVPVDFARAGYYTGRPPPGAIGPAIIVAHVDSKSGPAVFARLRDLKPGDEVTVTRADRSPTPGATLRLITCGGSFDHRAGHYRDNVIAFAHYQSVTSAPERA